MGKIILPEDVASEQLRKEIAAMVKDPRRRLFEEYRAQGFDSETAAALSDLGSMDTSAQASIILEQAAKQSELEAVRNTAVVEIPQAIRNIGASAGGAIGSSIGLVMIQAAVKNSASLIVITSVSAGVVGALFAGKFVATVLGRVAGIATAANVVSAAALITWSIIKKGKR